MDANLFSKCIARVEQDVKAALADMEPHPYISIGGAKTQQPFEVLVREIATDYSIEDVVTNTYMGASRGGYSITFAVGVELWTKTADLVKSTATAQEWMARIMSSIASDKTLGGLCDHAKPFISSVGTAPSGNSYMASIEGGVRIKAFIDPIID